MLLQERHFEAGYISIIHHLPIHQRLGSFLLPMAGRSGFLVLSTLSSSIHHPLVCFLPLSHTSTSLPATFLCGTSLLLLLLLHSVVWNGTTWNGVQKKICSLNFHLLLLPPSSQSLVRCLMFDDFFQRDTINGWTYDWRGEIDKESSGIRWIRGVQEKGAEGSAMPH